MPVLAPHGNHGNTAPMTNFEAFKFFLIDLTDLAKDALHIYVALAIFLGSCLVFGWKTRQWRPWMLVLCAAILGEVWDIQAALDKAQRVRPWDNWHDIWNTMVVPTVLMITSRYSNIFAAGPAAAPPPEESGHQP